MLGLRLLNRCLALLLFVATLPGVATAEEQTLPPIEACQGTLVLESSTFRLPHAVAYETKWYGQTVLAVLFTERAISIDKLNTALLNDSGGDDVFAYYDPHVKVDFALDGKPIAASAYATGHSLNVSGGKELTGSLIVKNGRAQGNVTLNLDSLGKRKPALTAQFAGLVVSLSPTVATRQAVVIKTQPYDGGASKVSDLPLPADATEIEKNEAFEQITFQSKTDVRALTRWFSKQLKASNWQGFDDDDLVAPNSAILNRKQNGAQLTLFIMPNDVGSKVTIMASGMSWAEPGK